MSWISVLVGPLGGLRSDAGCVSECAWWELVPTCRDRTVIFRSASGVVRPDSGRGCHENGPIRCFFFGSSWGKFVMLLATTMPDRRCVALPAAAPGNGNQPAPVRLLGIHRLMACGPGGGQPR